MRGRAFISAAVALAVLAGTGRAQRSGAAPLRMIVVGQALTDYDIRKYRLDSFTEMKAALHGGDVTFSNLEVPIRTSEKVKPVKEGVVAHGAPPAVLDALKELGFNLLSLSNNHAWDLGAPGLLDTIAEARKRGFIHAGTGRTLDEAAAPAFLDTRGGRIALVAMASGGLMPESPAGPGKPGVNELKLDEQRNWHSPDLTRILASIRAARQKADHVIVYQHHHYWADDLQETPVWLKRWAHQSIDAGATMFVAHGVPILHGIEIYKGRPIFYSLGNFIFHTRQIGRWPALAWRSVIADLPLPGHRAAGPDGDAHPAERRGHAWRSVQPDARRTAARRGRGGRGHPQSARGHLARAWYGDHRERDEGRARAQSVLVRLRPDAVTGSVDRPACLEVRGH